MKLVGRTKLPGDKSISHRALLISALSQGRSTLTGLNQGADCMQTLACLRSLGVAMFDQGDTVVVEGRGLRLKQSQVVLGCGNSGTTLRLLAGVLAGQDFVSVLDGDASLQSRPMARIIEPLSLMGAELKGAAGGTSAPLTVRGGMLRGIRYELPIPSAQVKSAILLAGLQASGTTTVVEPVLSRDHTERMLKAAGANLERRGAEITLRSGGNLGGRAYQIPGDLSSAAFLIGAAAALPGSDVIIEDLGLNPGRLGFLEALQGMGASIEIVELSEDQGGEPVGTLRVRGAKLQATTIRGSLIPRLIDEIPILAVLATQAQGTTSIEDAAELRVKESDRLASLRLELSKLGANIVETATGLRVTGPTKLESGMVQSYGDHRLAMAFTVASLFAEGPVKVEGRKLAEISFPGFERTWRELVRG